MSTHRLLSGAQLHEPYHFVQESDPGAVGSKLYWLKVSTGQLKRRNDANSAWIAIGSGAGSFITLSDAPTSYVGQAAKIVSVKEDESGLEFIENTGGSGTIEGGVIGTASFNPSSGTISGLSMTGIITGVSRTSIGRFTVTINEQADLDYVVSAIASDDATDVTVSYLAGTSSDYTATSFKIITIGTGTGLRDPQVVRIAVMRTIVGSGGGGGGTGGGLFDFDVIDATEEDTFEILAPTNNLRTVKVNISEGDYILTFPIKHADALEGHQVHLFLNWVPKSRVQIDIYDEGIMGALLQTHTPQASAGGTLKFAFKGTAWESCDLNLIVEGIDPLSDLAVGLFGYWKFDTLTTDYSGNSYTLTNNNSVTTGTGKLGLCAVLVAASSQSLSIATDLLGGRNVFTVSVWIKSVGANMAIVGSETIYIGTISANVSQFVIVVGTVGYSVNGPAIPGDGSWNNLTVWKDLDGIYISLNNGTPVSNAVVGTVDAATFTRFGRGGDGSNYYDGSFDEFAMWDRVLSAEERSTYYNSGAANNITV